MSMDTGGRSCWTRGSRCFGSVNASVQTDNIIGAVPPTLCQATHILCIG